MKFSNNNNKGFRGLPAQAESGNTAAEMALEPTNVDAKKNVAKEINVLNERLVVWDMMILLI